MSVLESWLSNSSVAAESAANWATAVGLFLAIIVGFGATIRYLWDLRRSKISYADIKYENFLSSAIQYPQYAYGFWQSPERQDRVQLGGYYYFVAKALWSCEEILKCPGHEDWNRTVFEVLCDHKAYLASGEFAANKGAYHTRLVSIIDDVVAQYFEESDNA